MTWFQARISISEYIFLSVYEMASKFSARCARRLFLKKNIVKQEKTIGGYNFLRDMTPSGPENLIRGYIRISEYHYLGTRKPNKRIYPAIPNWRVCVSKLSPRSAQCTPLHPSKTTCFVQNCTPTRVSGS